MLGFFCVLRRWSHQATLAFEYYTHTHRIWVGDSLPSKNKRFGSSMGINTALFIWNKKKKNFLQKTEYLSNSISFTTEFDSLHICPDFSSVYFGVTDISQFQGDNSRNENEKIDFQCIFIVLILLFKNKSHDLRIRHFRVIAFEILW